MRQIDLFEQDINKFFEEGNVTKAQLFGAFHKANPNSLDEVEQLPSDIIKGQREQLLDFANWIDDHTVFGLSAGPEYYVRRYLEQ